MTHPKFVCLAQYRNVHEAAEGARWLQSVRLPFRITYQGDRSVRDPGTLAPLISLEVLESDAVEASIITDYLSRLPEFYADEVGKRIP